ncbi:Alpha/Beta hydrolase protein [Pterulicium gracile]|uniref:Alpha/Beta hydrolase protein n=1 Tax=Pterulicium gracile TaxID=1884261 RepID=A0A5C3QPI9_9AGAR|nr:Alpha/Beta hydrolase protein [Pterula gracilis]
MSPSPTELKFKSVDGVDIFVDVYLPEKASKENSAPVLLWWHGGGLLQGTRKGVAPHLVRAASKHNLCVVSADYRLAPQTRLPSILADCFDTIAFLRAPNSAFAQLVAGTADATNKLIVSGSSAGGFLALLVGLGIGQTSVSSVLRDGVQVRRLDPPVKAILPIYPITDLDDPFWTTKQRPVSYMPSIIPEERVAPFLDSAAEKTAFSTLDSPRAVFYHYMVQEGILPALLLENTSISPSTYSVAPAIRSRSCQLPIPPTYLIHGSIDDKVPPRQARDVFEALKAYGSEELGMSGQDLSQWVVYEEREGLDHLFDREEAEEMKDMYEFVKRVVG